jgi:hypothetical protein
MKHQKEKTNGCKADAGGAIFYFFSTGTIIRSTAPSLPITT